MTQVQLTIPAGHNKGTPLSDVSLAVLQVWHEQMLVTVHPDERGAALLAGLRLEIERRMPYEVTLAHLDGSTIKTLRAETLEAAIDIGNALDGAWEHRYPDRRFWQIGVSSPDNVDCGYDHEDGHLHCSHDGLTRDERDIVGEALS